MTEFLNESPEFFGEEREIFVEGHTRLTFKLGKNELIEGKVCCDD